MDISQLFSSFGKISFVAFAIILGFLIYEIYQIRKDKTKKEKPKVPQFNQVVTPNGIPAATTVAPQSSPSRSSSRLIVILVIFLVLSASVGFAGVFLVSGSKTTQTQDASVIVQEVKSTGIQIYTTDWQILQGKDVDSLKAGDTIIIGLKTIPEADIDEARIRINESVWTEDQVTKSYNADQKVYYRQYTIPEGFTELQIEAQLHSQRDGWLSE